VADSRTAALQEIGQRAADIARERVPGGSAVFESIEREAASGSGLLAGGVAYRFFLWLVPFGLLLAAGASFWVRSDPAAFHNAPRRFGLAGVAMQGAQSAIVSEAHARWYLLGLGLCLILYFGVSGERAMRIAYQIAWAARAPKRSPLTASLGFSAAVTLALALSILDRWVLHHSGTVLWLIALAAGLAAMTGLAFGVMFYLPHGEAPPRALVPGALVVAVGIEVLHVVVALYLAPKLARSSATYGALGAATVVLFWLYAIARLLISAAFLNATLWDRKTRT
jgi:uncharacterized BrkB/YihY/UPF0761 family membrane protein